MWGIGKKRIIENIDTEIGNDILIKLKSEGWKVVSQYSPLMFDKGIDYDSYTLMKNFKRIKFEWDNWFEWKISGPEQLMVELAKRFSLKKEQ